MKTFSLLTKRFSQADLRSQSSGASALESPSPDKADPVGGGPLLNYAQGASTYAGDPRAATGDSQGKRGGHRLRDMLSTRSLRGAGSSGAKHQDPSAQDQPARQYTPRGEVVDRRLTHETPQALRSLISPLSTNTPRARPTGHVGPSAAYRTSFCALPHPLFTPGPSISQQDPPSPATPRQPLREAFQLQLSTPQGIHRSLGRSSSRELLGAALGDVLRASLHDRATDNGSRSLVTSEIGIYVADAANDLIDQVRTELGEAELRIAFNGWQLCASQNCPPETKLEAQLCGALSDYVLAQMAAGTREPVHFHEKVVCAFSQCHEEFTEPVPWANHIFRYHQEVYCSNHDGATGWCPIVNEERKLRPSPEGSSHECSLRWVCRVNRSETHNGSCGNAFASVEAWQLHLHQAHGVIAFEGEWTYEGAPVCPNCGRLVVYSGGGLAPYHTCRN